MSKRTKPSAAKPSRRFPGFEPSPAWPLRALGEVLVDHKLKSDGDAEVHSVSLTKGVVPQIEHLGRSYSAKDTSHYTLVQPGDVVYTRSPLSIHKLGIIKQHHGGSNAIVSPLYGVFEPEDAATGRLIEAYFDSPYRSTHFLEPLAQKGAKNTIQLTNSNFLKGAIYLPTEPKERRKIAACLESLDAWIAVEARALAALRRHKTGMMQQLFPRPGQTRPRLRFPEFQNAGEWKVWKLLSTLEAITSGLTQSQTQDHNGLRVTRIEAISGGTIDLSRVGYIGTDDDVSDYRLAVGDILLSNINSVSHIGKSLIVDSDYDLYHGMNLLRLKVDAANHHPSFIYYSLNVGPVRDSIRARANKAVNQASINQTALGKTILHVPILAEQRRIADSLASLDARLAAQADKLAALRLHKRGLMQQLFPTPEGA